MNAKEAAKKALLDKFGPCADPSQVLDDIIGSDKASSTVCRNYAIRREFEARFTREAKSANGVHEQIADEFGLSRQAVSNIVLGQ
jgi:hypothetical protein